jgi:EAL domain-containing protein (putative c-di-GMP-specific phosphodiesterase class I)
MQAASLSASATTIPVLQPGPPAHDVRRMPSFLRRQRRSSAHPRESFDVPIRMAFQPIVDLRGNAVFAYEALLRGEHGEPAATIMRQVTEENRFAFDNACRKQSVIQASELCIQDVPASLSVNVCPCVVDSPDACIERTLDIADHLHFPVSKLILEITEHERLHDYVYLNHLVEKFRGYGIRTAIDDFGAGPAALATLEEIETDIIKLDMALVRGVNKNPSNCKMVESILQLANRLSIQVIAEGVETEAEYRTLARMGVYLMQGYYFARPELARLPTWKAPETSWQSLQPEPGLRVSPCRPEQPRSPRKTVGIAVNL